MPTSRSFRFASLALIVTFSAMSSACYKNVAIRPDQIPLLSEMPGATVVGQSGDTTVLAVPVRTVLTPDGTTAEIRGQYDLELQLATGQTLVFDHPVRSAFDLEGGLQITGSNRAATRFVRSDVREASVTQYDATLTQLTFIGCALLFLVGLGLVLLVASP